MPKRAIGPNARTPLNEGRRNRFGESIVRRTDVVTARTSAPDAMPQTPAPSRTVGIDQAYEAVRPVRSAIATRFRSTSRVRTTRAGV
jgi:hypothetical protein